MKTAIIFLRELLLLLALLQLLGTGTHSKMRFNSKSWISFTARKRCHRGTLTISLSFGHCRS